VEKTTKQPSVSLQIQRCIIIIIIHAFITWASSVIVLTQGRRQSLGKQQGKGVDWLFKKVSFQTAFEGVESGWKSDIKRYDGLLLCGFNVAIKGLAKPQPMKTVPSQYECWGQSWSQTVDSHPAEDIVKFGSRLPLPSARFAIILPVTDHCQYQITLFDDQGTVC